MADGTVIVTEFVENIVVVTDSFGLVTVEDSPVNLLISLQNEIIYIDDTVGPRGPQGPQGPAGTSGDTSFLHTQAVAASTWIISHNLNRYCTMTLYSPGFEIIYSDVVQGSLNTTTVSFPSPQTGYAVLI